jgi:HSP20 family protein
MDVNQSDAPAMSTSAKDQASQSGVTQNETRQPSQQGAAQNVNKQAGQQATAQNEKKDGTGQPRQDERIARHDAYLFMSPFALLQRVLTDNMAGIFDQPGTRLGRPKARSIGTGDSMTWVPKIDVVQRGNEVVIRADLPGVTPDQITIDVTDDAIILAGQRKDQHVENSGGVYRYERTYGAFYREIPLPDGAIVDRAKAAFKDGVLEITVPAPPEQVSRGRRLEISS